MPRSRTQGKGNRRLPGRDGGAGKRKAVPKPRGPAATTPQPVLEFWYDFAPSGLSKRDKDHPWVFAVYREIYREDGTYQAFLFRNMSRTIFGIREWFRNSAPRGAELQRLAHKVVTDKAARVSMISDDPDLPDMWKRR